MGVKREDIKQFGEYFEKYLVIRRRRLKEVSIQKEIIGHHEFWNHLKNKKFQGNELNVQREDIREYASLKFGEKSLMSNTARNKVYILKHFYNEAVRQDWIVSDPWSGIQLPKVEMNPINVLTVKQMKMLLESPSLLTAKGIRDRTIFELMYSSGLRVGDLLSLTATHFSEDYRTVRVIGKGDKEAVLPVGKMSAYFLRFYIEKIISKFNHNDNQPIFISLRTGVLMTKVILNNTLHSYTLPLFKRTFSSHIFRYSICTHLADEGVDIRLIQEFMRHSKPSTTMRYVQQSYQKLQQVFKETHPRS